MALDVKPILSPIAEPIAPPPLPRITERVAIKIVNSPNFQEATFRRVITPKVEIDQDSGEIRIISQGLSLSEERKSEGADAILVEVAARYRRGEGAIKQIYRFLVFTENGKAYCQRLPMGSWAPSDPDACFEWLGRGGHQQGDFVLLPRRRLPAESVQIPRPDRGGLLRRAVNAVQTFIGEALLDEEVALSDWERIIGRHDPADCHLFKKDARYYLVAPHDTVSNHPEHAPLKIPEGIYEIVEDRASSYWRKAID